MKKQTNGLTNITLDSHSHMQMAVCNSTNQWWNDVAQIK